MFINVRSLPPLLKLCWLVEMALASAVLVGAVFHLVRHLGALGFLPDLSVAWISVLVGLIPLVLALNLPVSWYARRMRRGAAVGPAPTTWQWQLLTIVLLAALPLAALLVTLLTPPTPVAVGLVFGLQILSLLLIVAAYIYIFSAGSSRPSVRLSRPSAGSVAPRPDLTQPDVAAQDGITQDGVKPGAATPDGGTPTQLAQTVPFAPGWWSFDLGRYRPCDGTYCSYAYESIPPIRDLDGTLDWLGPLDPQTDRQMEIHRNQPEARGRLAEIEAEAAKLGLTLPQSFVRLMGSPELQDRIPSCTACTFGLPEHIVPCPGSEQGYVIRFLNDQQDVLMWSLYLMPQGEERVLVSPYALDEVASWNDGAGPTAQQRETVIAHTRVCAPSFEAFIYRFWLENSIWFKLDAGENDGALSDAERRYLEHYAPNPTEVAG